MLPSIYIYLTLENMSLRDQLMEDQKQAMREKDSERLSMIRMVMAAVKNTEIDRGSVLNDTEIQEVIARQVKQLADALKDFTAGGRADLVEKTNKEMGMLSGYLPQQLSDEELEQIVEVTMAELGTKNKQDFGKIMGAITAKTKGLADGNRVRDIVQRLCV